MRFSYAECISRQNVARAAEYLPGAGGVEGTEWERHSGGSKGRCETCFPQPFAEDHGSLPPPPERPPEESSCCPNVRILVLAVRGAVWVATLEECLPPRREKACRGAPTRSAQFFA